MAFLDKTGVQHVWSKFITYLSAAITTIDETKANIESPQFTGTPSAPTAELGTQSDQIATCNFVKNMIDSHSLPSGAILAWSGSVESIPPGFSLCNGKNGTPNLQGRFILGASEDYPIDSEGGEETHLLTIDEMPSHDHEIQRGSMAVSGNYYSRASGNSENLNTELTGGDQPHNNMPPYYALCFIMKD